MRFLSYLWGNLLQFLRRLRQEKGPYQITVREDGFGNRTGWHGRFEADTDEMPPGLYEVTNVTPTAFDLRYIPDLNLKPGEDDHTVTLSVAKS